MKRFSSAATLAQLLQGFHMERTACSGHPLARRDRYGAVFLA